MPSDIPLTPEAAAVWTAFKNGMEAGEVFACGPSEGLTAALRELADQLRNFPMVSKKEVWEERVRTHNRITAIAEDIERAVTYATTETPANA